MITQEHQELLRKAVATNEKETVNSVFQKVLKEEFGAIRGLNQVAQDYLNDLSKLIIIPSETEVKISQNKGIGETRTSSVGLLHLLISLIVLVVVAAIGSKFGLVWGICLSVIIAVFVFFFAKKNASKKVSYVSDLPKFTVLEIYNADEVIELAGNIMKKMKGLVEEMVDFEPKINSSVQLPLHECYPNILKWLQMVYSDALDFDEEARMYLLKRIVSIAHSCYYDVVNYNGSNENLFEKETGYNIDVVEMFSPTIIYNKTGKVILSGKIYIPSK